MNWSRPDKAIRWCGTACYCTGIALTSFNVYPWNLILQVGGASFWVWAAVRTNDKPLTLLEGYAFLTYGAGLVTAAWAGKFT